MHIDPESKQTASFRLTREAFELLAMMARKLGLPRSRMLEMLIRDRAKQERIQETTPPDMPSC